MEQSDSDQRAAVLEVIEAETDAYLRCDFDRWEQYWLDTPEIRRIHSHVGTGVTVVEGAEVRARMRRVMSKGIKGRVGAPISRENVNIVLSQEMAWVTYEQVGEIAGELGELAGRYHELKVLHKIAGCWKIACIAGHQIRVDHVVSPLIEIDPNGVILWMNDAAEKRLMTHPKLGVSGARLQTTDSDAQSELLSAANWIAEIRDRHSPCSTAEAVTRGIALGQDDYGLMHVCWVVLKDGKCLIVLDDVDRLQRQMAVAIEIYSLSEAQGKLAKRIIEGDDLATGAQALGISPNTAKTHKQRIYDKTGVRTQSALVRLLLNAEPTTV